MGHWKTSFEKNWGFFLRGRVRRMGYPTGDKHTISTFVDQTHIKMGQRLLHNHNKVLCLNDVEMSPCCY